MIEFIGNDTSEMPQAGTTMVQIDYGNGVTSAPVPLVWVANRMTLSYNYTQPDGSMDATVRLYHPGDSVDSTINVSETASDKKVQT